MNTNSGLRGCENPDEWLADSDRLRARVQARIEISDSGCWIWQAGTNGAGYARISVKGASVSVHRLSYVLFKGPIPDNKPLDHLCRNTLCVNPAHLEPVTQVENVVRGIAVRKPTCRHGHVSTGRRQDRCIRCRAEGNRKSQVARVARRRAAGGFDRKSAQRARPNTRTLEFLGQTRPLAEWAERYKMPYSVVKTRIKLGWTPARALTEPVRPCAKSKGERHGRCNA